MRSSRFSCSLFALHGSIPRATLGMCDEQTSQTSQPTLVKVNRNALLSPFSSHPGRRCSKADKRRTVDGPAPKHTRQIGFVWLVSYMTSVGCPKTQSKIRISPVIGGNLLHDGFLSIIACSATFQALGGHWIVRPLKTLVAPAAGD